VHDVKENRRADPDDGSHTGNDSREKKVAMDKIYIKNLELFAKHGVFPEENVLGQKFVVSAVLYTDIREAGQKR
jgi:hypothetical protein